VAAECAELLGMETSAPKKLGVVAKCAGPATECGSMAEWEGQFRGGWVWGGVCRVARDGDVSSDEAGRGGQVCWPGDRVRLDVGMETSVSGRLGVAAECAELLGMEAPVPMQLGVAAKCAELLGMETSVAVVGPSFTRPGGFSSPGVVLAGWLKAMGAGRLTIAGFDQQKWGVAANDAASPGRTVRASSGSGGQLAPARPERTRRSRGRMPGRARRGPHQASREGAERSRSCRCGPRSAIGSILSRSKAGIRRRVARRSLHRELAAARDPQPWAHTT